MTNSNETEHAIRSLLLKLRQGVEDLSLAKEIIGLLLPGGRPHDFESELWDYKEKLPELLPGATEENKKLFKAEIGDIIKDVVAFHNAYGGYIVFGVADKGKNRLKGCIANLTAVTSIKG